MIALADCNTFFASLDIPLLEPARAIASPYPEGRDLGWGQRSKRARAGNLRITKNIRNI